MNINVQPLIEFLPQQRWFGSKARTLRSVAVRDHAVLEEGAGGGESLVLALLDVSFTDGIQAIYQMPLLVNENGDARDAMDDVGRLSVFGRALARGETYKGEHGAFRFGGPGLDPLAPPGHGSVRAMGAEQSNSSIVMDDAVILKLIRRVEVGDNVYLGDRDGVRTPMQWNGDRNAGFSSADFAQLYLPVLMDPIYGYAACNVEAELRSPHSFLHWFKQLLAIRKQHPVFGVGSFEVLHPDNAAIMAFIREHGEDVVLCVNNLSSRAQAVELDLSPQEGMYPIELMGRERFPRIGELPYLLTIPAHGFYWFQLTNEDSQ